MKRRARVPQVAIALSEKVSKADLLEAAWNLASLCNATGSCDDDESTVARLSEELALVRRAR